MSKRRKFTSSFKTKVVLEALKERSTIQELGRKYELHPSQITQWKTQFLSNAEQVFDSLGETKTPGIRTKKWHLNYKYHFIHL